MTAISPISFFKSQKSAPLQLVDLSMVSRAGAKGTDTPAWMKAAGLPLPEASNTSVRHEGGLVARLAPGEVLLLDNPRAPGSWTQDAMTHLGAGQGLCFPMPRFDSHAWFTVVGEAAPQMFAKVCGVDLRPKAFADLQIAQTSVARINAIVIRDDETFKDKSKFPSYHVLADWTSARSLWAYLMDAMAEFDGGPVSIADLS
ncbi:hypothetical protein V5T82_12105 [Magnetovibrio sp. PR-2]|uniref:sarcosine oxidase subunit gamma n=1 Tax=Magnetovibrio sp. PR-2 TaxID=3120356 RepID=UPI002FCE28F7